MNNELWNYVHTATKVLFPDEVRETCKLVAEFIPDGEFYSQYRLYLDEHGNKK